MEETRRLEFPSQTLQPTPCPCRTRTAPSPSPVLPPHRSASRCPPHLPRFNPFCFLPGTPTRAPTAPQQGLSPSFSMIPTTGPTGATKCSVTSNAGEPSPLVHPQPSRYAMCGHRQISYVLIFNWWPKEFLDQQTYKDARKHGRDAELGEGRGWRVPRRNPA